MRYHGGRTRPLAIGDHAEGTGRMTNDSAKTIFITGATGLVGGHAAEEALRRGHRVRALVRPTSDTRWLDQWGVEHDRRRPGRSRRPSARASPVPTGSSTAPPRWATGAPWRSSGGSTSRRSGYLLDAACEAQGRAVRPRQLAGRLRRPRPLRHRRDGAPRRRIRSTPTPGRRPRPRPWSSSTIARRGLPAAIVRPGFIYGERDRTVLPKLLTNLRRGTFASSARASRCSTASTSRTWSTASSWRPRAPRPSARSST